MTLIFHPSDEIELVLSPDTGDDLFHFSPEVDFFFAYEPDTVPQFTFTPYNIQAMALLSEPLASVTPAMLTDIDWLLDPMPVALNPTDTLVLLLDDGTMFLLGHVRLLTDWTVSFDYSNAIPEPSALLLLGAGCLGVTGFVIRQKHKNHQSQGGTCMKNIGKMLMLVMLLIPFLIGNAIAAELTVMLQGTGNGRVLGDGIDCGTDCTETYPDETIVHLEARPAPDTRFVGWLVDGAPQQGALVIRRDITVTALFEGPGQLGDIQLHWDEATRTLTITFPSGNQHQIQEKDWDMVQVAISPHAERVAVLYDTIPVGSQYYSDSVSVAIYTRNGDELGYFLLDPPFGGKIIVADDGRFAVYGTDIRTDSGSFRVYSADGQLVKTITQGNQLFGGQGDAWFVPFGGIFVIVCSTHQAISAELLLFDYQYNLIKQHWFDEWPFPGSPIVRFDEAHEYIEVCDEGSWDLLIFTTQGELLERRTGCQ